MRATYDIRLDLGAPGPSPAAVGRGGGKTDQGWTTWRTNDAYASITTSRVTSVRGGGKAPAADAGMNVVTTMHIGGGRSVGNASDDGDVKAAYGADVGADVAVTGSRSGAKSDDKDTSEAGDGADTVASSGRGGGTSNNKDTPVVDAPGGNELP